jgi:hypothetical protein
MLSEIVPGQIWATERPVWFSGVRLRARTSIVRLEDGRLLVHSPAPPSEDSKQLNELGEVAFLFVPNCFHHLGTPAAVAAFPNAKVVGPKSAAERNRALRIDVDIRDPKFLEDASGIELFPLDGVPFLDETLVFHRSTRTLLGADVVLRADAKDHFSWRLAARLTGCFERVRVPPDVRKKVVDKDAAARSLHALETLPIERLVIAHGDVVEGAPLASLQDAWRLVGVG